MRPRHNDNPGFALIAVLVALSILLALVAPFLAAMLNEADISSNVVAQAQVDHANEGQREFLLYLASMTDQANDLTPFFDSRNEFPKRLDLPAAFRSGGLRKYSVIHSGEVWDLQGRVQINTASPLLIANLLSLSASLKEEVPPDGDTLEVDAAGNFPEENGMLLVDGEVIPYQERDGSVFSGLTRTLEDHTLPEDVLVLDYRCVVLVTRMFDPNGQSPRNRLTPYSQVGQLNRITERGVSGFTEAEMDVLRKHCTTDAGLELSARWGKAQRVFGDQEPHIYPATLRVKSALGFGAGTLVRIRSLEDDTMEYAMVAKTTVVQGLLGDINLQRQSWQLVLLRPLRNAYRSLETVVEPLVRHPININTAEPEVLVAMLLNLRRAPRRPHAPGREGKGGDRSRYGPKIDRSYARDVANRIVQLRGDAGDGDGIGPFQGFQDLCQRLLTPLGQEAPDRQRKELVLLILQNWLTG
ncbi:MAG: type II secretion system protein, partial [Planctomycetota bacterium]